MHDVWFSPECKSSSFVRDISFFRIWIIQIAPTHNLVKSFHGEKFYTNIDLSVISYVFLGRNKMSHWKISELQMFQEGILLS